MIADFNASQYILLVFLFVCYVFKEKNLITGVKYCTFGVHYVFETLT